MIGILEHPLVPATQTVSAEIKAWLEARGETVWRGSNWDETGLTDQVDRLRLLIVLGGDGSILRASRIAAPADVPLFSVNMGRLGFLSEAEVGQWPHKLAAALDGDCWYEKRLMLKATIKRQGRDIDSLIALNEVVVGRGAQARVVRLALSIDGHDVTEYAADALIAATPTGSTAYSLAAGGPVLPPQLDNFLVVPAAPHMSLDRAIVLHKMAQVKVRVTTDHEVNVTADGQETVALENGDEIHICHAPQPCRFVRTGEPSYFYRRLIRGLGFNREVNQ